MSEIKNTMSISVPIGDVMIEGIDKAAADAINAAMKEQGVPNGTPLTVEIVPRKYDYLATATWDKTEVTR